MIKLIPFLSRNVWYSSINVWVFCPSGHEESYNPPPEYLPTEDEVRSSYLETTVENRLYKNLAFLKILNRPKIKSFLEFHVQYCAIHKPYLLPIRSKLGKIWTLRTDQQISFQRSKYQNFHLNISFSPILPPIICLLLPASADTLAYVSFLATIISSKKDLKDVLICTCVQDNGKWGYERHFDKQNQKLITMISVKV